MQKEAIEGARRAIRSAEIDLSYLKKVPSLEEAEHFWGHFLGSIYKVYEKLKAGAKGTSSWSWYEAKITERDRDELLAYLHAARNCETNRLERISAEQRLTYLTAPGGVTMSNVRIQGGKTTHDPPQPTVRSEQMAFVDAIAFVAKPVVNRERHTRKLRTYDLPRLHKGQVINKLYQSIHPIFMGDLALIYIRELAEDASKLRQK